MTMDKKQINARPACNQPKKRVPPKKPISQNVAKGDKNKKQAIDGPVCNQSKVEESNKEAVKNLQANENDQSKETVPKKKSIFQKLDQREDIQADFHRIAHQAYHPKQ